MGFLEEVSTLLSLEDWLVVRMELRWKPIPGRHQATRGPGKVGRALNARVRNGPHPAGLGGAHSRSSAKEKDRCHCVPRLFWVLEGQMALCTSPAPAPRASSQGAHSLTGEADSWSPPAVQWAKLQKACDVWGSRSAHGGVRATLPIHQATANSTQPPPLPRPPPRATPTPGEQLSPKAGSDWPGWLMKPLVTNHCSLGRG